MNNLSLVFNSIQGLNPKTSTVSSIGTFVSAQSQQIAQMILNETVDLLPVGSLAYNILRDSKTLNFSDKQLWVISYELIKNEAYVANLVNINARQEAIISQKEQASKDKLTANKAASQNVLDLIKAEGKKLGDYYKWLKNSSFKKEFFNKKYTIESTTQFINL